MRINLAVLFLVVLFSASNSALAQSPNGSISGVILDPDVKSVPGAEIIVLNELNGAKYVSSTNGEGIYAVPNLPPGSYRIQVSKIGFKSIIKPDIVLNVQDALSLNFTLPIGATSVTVTVEGGAPLINTQDATVSTVVDREFVENTPLNGRSLQDLILLTPGIVTNSPQSSGSIGVTGEFSVNGQRTESNYYTVDGVSANVGITSYWEFNGGVSGSLPSATALGTTQALVSVDALQEFRVQSSTYSSEYGRNPGGQFSLVTRSGTNTWHGTAFDYLRNDAVDASDWFNDYYKIPKTALRQNDFGGTLGGPIRIPHLYNGKNKTFFFFSYEGLRLIQPHAASLLYVPDNNLRQNTPNPLGLVMNAFPSPTGPEVLDSSGNPTGFAQFIGAWSNPSAIDSYSIRLDHSLTAKQKLFFRFADAPSVSSTLFPPILISTKFTSKTYSVGLTSNLTQHAANDLRFNYSSNDNTISSALSSMGGAHVVDLLQLQGFDKTVDPSSDVSLILFFSPNFTSIEQGLRKGIQRQWNVVDATDIALGRHELKFGVDYRRLAPVVHVISPSLTYYFLSQASVLTNTVDSGFAQSNVVERPIYQNFSAFVQDEWRFAPRWSLSMGLRWDVNPAPSTADANTPYTVLGNINDPSSLKLAPRGTSLWRTGWHNFAPRLGAAYTLGNRPGRETVLRGGVGLFFDTGQQLGSVGYFGPGVSGQDQFSGTSFPTAGVVPTIISVPVAPYPTVYGSPQDLALPLTLQWNVAVQQALGKSQVLTATYVGANGRRLLEQRVFSVAKENPNFTNVALYQNGLTSDYNALQVQYQRRLSHGVQTLASYTWSHSIDYGSENGFYRYTRGNSEFDVRHNLSAAVSYDLPSSHGNRFVDAILNTWGLDGRFMARTGFPITLNGPFIINPLNGEHLPSGLDIVPGEPLYVYGRQYPGGRAVNGDAFRLPSGCSSFSCPTFVTGDAPRNLARGFGAWQLDLAVRRDFPIHENLKLEFRAEAFNIFNHPNFGSINPNYCSPSPGCTFGQAQATLANSLGVLSPIYQMGGARSMQFALKVNF